MGEYFFMVAYTIEFLLKLVRYRLLYFYDIEWRYNMLDLFLLILTYYFMFVATSLPNVSWLRMLRLLRLGKALRVLRLVAMIKPLRAMLKSIVGTVGTLGWSVMLLAAIFFLLSLVLVLRVAAYLQDVGSAVDPTVHADLVGMYGSVSMTMVNLYIATMVGDWTGFYILEPMGWFDQGFFLFAMAFTQIAVLNIILGVFVDDAMKCMEAGPEELARDWLEEKEQLEQQLHEIFNEVDSTNSGRMDEKEWDDACSNGNLGARLHLLGFRFRDVLDFYRLMSKMDLAGDPSGAVEINNFVRGCMRLRGRASGFDVQMVLFSVATVCEQVQDQQRVLDQLVAVSSGGPSRASL